MYRTENSIVLTCQFIDVRNAVENVVDSVPRKKDRDQHVEQS